jgi:deoxyribodipyrimidine photo-lyase
MKPIINIMWFRRDLRLIDNAAFYHALKSNNPVLPVFIFDKNILNDLENKYDRRVNFIHAALEELQEQLISQKSNLEVFYSTPVETFQTLLEKYTIDKVFTNRDYEQYAIEIDAAIEKLLHQQSASMHSYKDQVIFEKDEIIKDDGTPYTVFTPYSRKWKAKLNPFYLKPYPTEKYCSNLFKQSPKKIPSLESMNFKKVDIPFPSKELNETVITHYSIQRDYPSAGATSKLGVHLRFGTISIRQIAKPVKEINETFLNELIWRDFYHSILWHFSHVRMGKSFKKEYDLIEWINNEDQFKQWCEGKTGYPIVDAGMRELNATGYMHNRIRMIVASFLTKHLLIDWRWGEAYFATKLLDFDYASNNGGWQWASGSGCDAAPYFRVFNPTLQTVKFDKNLKYIRQWVPELDSFDYPKPIVQHEAARKRALETYSKFLKKSSIRI